MPVTWTNSPNKPRVTHVGLVMSSATSREIRAMSDVWCQEYSCTVWNPETRRPETLVLGNDFSDSSEFGHAEVDISAEIKAEWDAVLATQAAEQAIRDARQAEIDAEKAAKDEVLEIKFGAEVVVVSGNKVPRGTRGKCIGIYDGNYGGKRVGILDAAGGKHYTDKNNCQGVIPGCHVDYVPPGGWRAYRDALPPEVEVVVPKKNNRVRRISDGLEGVVFWVKGTRLGFKVPGSQEPNWVDANEVVILDIKGNVKNPPPVAQEPEPPREPPKVNPLAHLPAPYCDIRGVLPPIGDNPSWTAVDERGEFLMNLTETGAAQIKALVAAQE